MLYSVAIILKIFEKITKIKTDYIHYAISSHFDNKRPLILEIGAHNGDDTVRFSKLYPEGTIYTFEPDPRLTEFLLAKFQKFKNIKFYSKAIFSSTTRLPFNLAHSENQTNFKNTGSSSILDYKKESSKKFNKKTEVDTIHLTEIKELRENKLDLIWIDVQGAERIIIESHMEFFQKSNLIWIEYGEDDYTDFYTRAEVIKAFRQTHSVSLFSNRGRKGNLLLVRL